MFSFGLIMARESVSGMRSGVVTYHRNYNVLSSIWWMGSNSLINFKLWEGK